MPSPTLRARALAASLAVVLLAAAAAPVEKPSPRHAPATREVGAPAAPPDGTYVYALSRDGADQGTTTVVIYRRADAREIETDEAGALGAARLHAIAAYRYEDLAVASYVATYQAPFLRTSPIGAARRAGAENGFYDQATLRYRGGGDLVATVDGAPNLAPPAPLPRDPSMPKSRYVLDAPFMTSVLMLPAFRHRTGDRMLAPVAPAFDANGDAVAVPMRLVRATPHAPKTPRSDEALQVDGIATVWFDRGNDLVHEAHFDQLNLDARLVSYARATRPAPFEPAPAPSLDARPDAFAVTFDSDGTTLAGVIDLPATPKRLVPIVAFVPPGPSAGRNFGGDGPSPMYPDLARAFAARGYAVLRYDSRGIGRSGGSSTETWDEALADAESAIRAAGDQDGIDPKRVYVAGYGNGADLALAASSTADADVAGVVALAPSVVPYRTCDLQNAEAASGARTPAQKAKADAAFAKASVRSAPFARTSYGHDPGALAARAVAPLFVLHPGIPTCAETRDQIESYDDRLRAANARATIVIASDLSAVFGGRYDADSETDTQEFFPYRFDASTAGAIADWLDSPKAAAGKSPAAGSSAPRSLPPPPPAPAAGDQAGGFPNPHASRVPPVAAPGQPALPATLASPTPEPSPAPAPLPAPTPAPEVQTPPTTTPTPGPS
jgi:alpha/beta superfamily hydrolase